MKSHECPIQLPHPGLAIFAPWCPAVDLPSRAALNEFAGARALTLPDGTPLRFVTARASTGALDFERAVAQRGEIMLREGSVHDTYNALAWLALTQAKAALNAVHVREAEAATPNRRDRRRDAATLLDESGLLLVCDTPELSALLRERQWRTLFWDRRAQIAAHMRPIAIGHGLCAKLASGRPYRGVTAKVLLLDLPIDFGDASLGRFDSAAAALIRGDDFAPEQLLPLPVAALPGWDWEDLGSALFDDRAVFRPAVLR
jgi:Protein of unknown function (DUF3025)